MIQVTSLETRTGKSLQNPDNPTNNNFTQSDDNVTNNSEKIVRSPNELRQYLSTNCHFYESKSVTHKDMQFYKTSFKLYLITRFSLSPPELMTIVDMVGKYYRWLNVSSKTLKHNLVIGFLDEDLKKSAWIDAIKCQILPQNKALHELILWLETMENMEDIDHGMVSLCCHLYHVT